MTTHIQRSALLPYPAQALYDLVNDVASYPQFLPWCSSAEVLESSETHMRASLNIAKGGLSQRFVTRNTLVPGQSIEMNLEEGPFNQLHGVWVFSRSVKKPARSASTCHSITPARWCEPPWGRCSIRRPIPWSTRSASAPSRMPSSSVD